MTDAVGEATGMVFTGFGKKGFSRVHEKPTVSKMEMVRQPDSK